MKAERKHQFEGHKGPLYALANFQNGKILSGGSDRRVVEWDLGTAEGSVLANSAAAIVSLLHLPKKDLLLVGQMEGGVHLVDLKARKEINYLKGHENYIFDIKYLPKKDELIFSSGDGSLSVWSATSNERLYHRSLCKPKLRKMELSADHKELLICRGDGVVSRFSTEDYSEIGQVKGNAGFNVARYLADGKHLIAADKQAHLHLVEIDNGKILQSLPAHYWPIYDIQLAPEGDYFATASRDKTVKIWDATDLKVLERIEGRKYGGHSHSVNSLLWPEESRLISASDDSLVKLWQIEA